MTNIKVGGLYIFKHCNGNDSLDGTICRVTVVNGSGFHDADFGSGLKGLVQTAELTEIVPGMRLTSINQ